jgi:hypothetical protein
MAVPRKRRKDGEKRFQAITRQKGQSGVGSEEKSMPKISKQIPIKTAGPSGSIPPPATSKLYTTQDFAPPFVGLPKVDSSPPCDPALEGQKAAPKG